MHLGLPYCSVATRSLGATAGQLRAVPHLRPTPVRPVVTRTVRIYQLVEPSPPTREHVSSFGESGTGLAAGPSSRCL